MPTTSRNIRRPARCSTSDGDDRRAPVGVGATRQSSPREQDSPALDRDAQSILIVDDDPDSLDLLARVFAGEAFEVHLARGGAAALEIVRDTSPDLVMLDIRMPDLGGFDVCRRIKADPASAHVPILFLTASTSWVDERSALELGAIDFITKPFNPHVVRLRVRNHMRYVRQRKLLEHLAHIDPLTEIPNRRGMDAELEREIDRARRQQSMLSFGVIDIDRFKQVNDRLGHPEGDRILRLLTQTLGSAMRRPGDVLARFGGDEFVVLLPDTGRKEAFEIAEQMRKKVADLAIACPGDGTDGLITVSIGGVSLTPEQDRTAAEYLAQADANLYCAKRAGRDHVVWSMISKA